MLQSISRCHDNPCPNQNFNDLITVLFFHHYNVGGNKMEVANVKHEWGQYSQHRHQTLTSSRRGKGTGKTDCRRLSMAANCSEAPALHLVMRCDPQHAEFIITNRKVACNSPPSTFSLPSLSPSFTHTYAVVLSPTKVSLGAGGWLAYVKMIDYY